MITRTFDWLSHHDERSLNYPIRATVPPQRRRKKYWRAPRVRLDQGREGACVGFAFATEVYATPRGKVRVDEQRATNRARALYNHAQRLDEWPGENYEGTSVLAGAKATVAAGLATGYRWAFSVDEIIDALIAPARLGGGPVVVGIPWYEQMYQTARNGMVIVGGRQVGGHAITLTGYHPRRRFRVAGGYEYHEVIRWRNSWGDGYGINGDGYVTTDVLRWLLRDVGEACVMTGRATPH